MKEIGYKEIFANAIRFHSDNPPLDPDGKEIGQLVVGPEWFSMSGRFGFWWFKTPSGRWFFYCRDGRKSWVDDEGLIKRVEEWLAKGEDVDHQRR